MVAQVGAVLGVFLKARSKDTKGVALSSFITGIFGITEPAIYGITLRFKKPFIFGCIAGSVGAIVASFFEPYYFAYAGLPGILTIVNAISDQVPTSFLGELIGCGIALIGSVVLIQIFGFGETVNEDKTSDQKLGTKGETSGNNLITAPLAGEILPLTVVPDEVFASGVMGSGVAVIPTDNTIFAPFDGKVTMIATTKHAIGLTSNDGVEMLIHVGIDTVKLNGAPYQLNVTSGQEIHKGDKLMTVDLAQIEKAGLSIITPIIITNSADFQQVEQQRDGAVSFDDAIIQLG